MVPEKAEYAVVTVPMYPLDVLVKVHVPLHAAAADITFCASVLETLVSMQYLMVVPLACDPPPSQPESSPPYMLECAFTITANKIMQNTAIKIFSDLHITIIHPPQLSFVQLSQIHQAG